MQMTGAGQGLSQCSVPGTDGTQRLTALGSSVFRGVWVGHDWRSSLAMGGDCRDAQRATNSSVPGGMHSLEVGRQERRLGRQALPSLPWPHHHQHLRHGWTPGT